jgi:hypothetical protein
MKEAFSFEVVMLKPIPGFPDYFVDELGNVWSQKPSKSSKWRPPYQTKLNPNLRGGKHLDGARYCVRLCKHVNSIRTITNRTVSSLVLETFVGPRPKGMVVRHGVRGPLDDSLDNVSWGTQKENIADEIRDGTKLLGEKHHQSKLNELQVRIIRRAYSRWGKDGLSLQALAEIFNVDQSNVGYIVSRRTWTHI